MTPVDEELTTQQLPDQAGPAAWRGALAGAMFFAVIGLASVFAEWPYARPFWLSPVVMISAAYLFVVAGVIAGWSKGFPRWSYPFVIYAFVFALYWTNVATPGLKIFGHVFNHGELWGWRAWIPLTIALLIAIDLTRSLRPLAALWQGVCRDWTQLSFGLYGLLPLAALLVFDEVSNRIQLPYMIGATLLLTSGAWHYMRARDRKSRAQSLLLAAAVLFVLAAIGNGIYWHGRKEPWMLGPADGYREAIGILITGILVLALVFSPALLELRSRFRPEQPA